MQALVELIRAPRSDGRQVSIKLKYSHTLRATPHAVAPTHSAPGVVPTLRAPPHAVLGGAKMFLIA